MSSDETSIPSWDLKLLTLCPLVFGSEEPDPHSDVDLRGYLSAREQDEFISQFVVRRLGVEGHRMHTCLPWNDRPSYSVDVTAPEYWGAQRDAARKELPFMAVWRLKKSLQNFMDWFGSPP